MNNLRFVSKKMDLSGSILAVAKSTFWQIRAATTSCVWSWVFQICGIACVEVLLRERFLGIIMIPRCSSRSLICLAKHFKILMTLRCICILFGSRNPFLDQALRDISVCYFVCSYFFRKFLTPLTFWLKREKECCPRGLQGCGLVTLREKVPGTKCFSRGSGARALKSKSAGLTSSGLKEFWKGRRENL